MKELMDIVIIGGGPAGLSAAAAAFDSGAKKILILERDKELGGILNQCIHNGFGLHTFKEELTGPEYAARYIKLVEEKNIEVKLETMVLSISLTEDNLKKIICMNRKEGMAEIKTQTVILAMGCRERPRGALRIPGYRPAGIFSAGTAQHYVNIEGKMPGREIVILGSGDIGLIMARRLTLEGAKVKAVAELMPYSGGLRRNIVQCLDDYQIPLLLSHTVVDIKGKERVEGVVIAEVDDKGTPIKETEKLIPCDTLLLSCGLIPENELSKAMGVKMNVITGGPIVNESLETNIPGVFACGNVLHVHDLVDYVSGEAKKAGEKAAQYVKVTYDIEKNEEINKQNNTSKIITLTTGEGVRYTVPSTIRTDKMDDTEIVRFRVSNVFKNCRIVAKTQDKSLISMKRPVLAPGEMEQIKLKKADLLNSNSDIITISIEQD